MKKNYNDKQVYFVGGGLASLAGAAYLIRDFGLAGENIHILESLNIVGGSNDGIGTPEKGFVCRGGRMLNEETYENFWDLFSYIPSIDEPGISVTEEILAFDQAHPTHSNARLVNKYGEVLDVMSMGFSQKDRMALLKLVMAPEEGLNHMKITDWFASEFFETNFWYMWQTTFAFQKYSSLFEFRRYILRMIFEFSRIQTLEGVTRTPYNQYDSVILPLEDFLKKKGVDFSLKCTVTDLDFKEGEDITVTGIHYEDEKGRGILSLKDGDLCLVTNGCMTDCAALGDLDLKAPYLPEQPISAMLWEKLANKKAGLGNPKPFFGNPEQTNWESFTVTLRGNKLLKMIETFSRNIPGSGALMTFKDSSWLMSIVVAAQPHFRNQPKEQTIFWGYGLYTAQIGDYVKKPMRECTGRELLKELIYQLHFEERLDEIMEDVVNVIPCMMPYVDAQFQPRSMEDRPPVIPKDSVNLGFISQFVEIPEDMVFTEEYSIRAARTAIYSLMGSNRKICPVTPHHRDVVTLLKALNTSFR